MPYTVTKGAIQNFTATLAQLWGEKGIRVNCVAPGPVWTPLISGSFPAEKTKEFGKKTPLKRPAQPAELAAVYVLLASQDGSYINGATAQVTGGMPTPGRTASPTSGAALPCANSTGPPADAMSSFR